MPIEISTAIEALEQEQFHALDRQIMGIIFDIHNEFGPLLDESLYKLEIAERCLTLPSGRSVARCALGGS